MRALKHRRQRYLHKSCNLLFLSPAILILTICHGGCEGGWANAKVVSRFCQEGNTRKTGIDRSRSKKRGRAPDLLMAFSQKSWGGSATGWEGERSRVRGGGTAGRCCFP